METRKSCRRIKIEQKWMHQKATKVYKTVQRKLFCIVIAKWCQVHQTSSHFESLPHQNRLLFPEAATERKASVTLPRQGESH